MKLFLRRNAPLFYALGAMLALYIPWLNRGYNNFEYPFVLAGRALAFSADADLINAYWPDIANPLGYSFVLSLVYKVFGFSDSFWISRLPALFGAALVMISGWAIGNSIWSQKKNLFYIWATLLVFQPMFMVFRHLEPLIYFQLACLCLLFHWLRGLKVSVLWWRSLLVYFWYRNCH